MKISTIISLESGDMARNDAIADVYAWIGGFRFSEADARPFGRVRGNAFTLDDIDEIEKLINREVGRPLEVVFSDAKVQAGHEEGMHAAKANAARRFAAFVSNLHEDLRAALPS